MKKNQTESEMLVDVSQEVRSRLISSLTEFVRKESKLFKAKISERALCSSLSQYLGEWFYPWNSDVEYNRVLMATKRSFLRSRAPNPKGHLVTPDIIVHRRLEPKVNLLAIEAKLEDGESTDADREKLRSYMDDPLCYPNVALLVFSSDGLPWCRCEFFRNRENPLIPKRAFTLRGITSR